VLVPEVVEVKLDGSVVERVSLGESLSLRRVGFDSHVVTEMGLDWGHANAVIPDGPDHWIVSLRHQDALVRLHHSGEVDWILSNPEGWPEHLAEKRLQATEPDFEWPFHQHAPQRLADGGLAVFDNGNHRSTPYGEPSEDLPYSRLVIFDVDPVARTVSKRWSMDTASTTGRLYSWAMGDADLLPGGNLLGVYGHLSGEAEISNIEAGRGDLHGRVLEVDLETGDAVLDLRLSSRWSAVPRGWRIYRAQRVEALLPSAPD
jgi:hypothetical protein